MPQGDAAPILTLYKRDERHDSKQATEWMIGELDPNNFLVDLSATTTLLAEVLTLN